MIAAGYTIKQDDVGAPIIAVLNQAGAAVDLSTATGVLFLMRSRSTGAAQINAAATVTGAGSGEVTYTPVAGDLDTPGLFDAEWQVTFASGQVATFPSGGYTLINVVADLD